MKRKMYVIVVIRVASQATMGTYLGLILMVL